MAVICNKDREVIEAQAAIAAGEHNQPEIIRLVEKAAKGNLKAFGDLYSIFLDRIYRYVFYHIRDKMTAEDITEEVFIKAWKAIGSCRGKEKTFSSWLYRIAHNQLVNTLRSCHRITSLDLEKSADTADPKQEIELGIEYQEVLKLINLLPENQKQVIILKFIEGLDNEEISRITHKSEGAIRVTQMRALATLREKLSEEG
ncbi:MAG: hypothetical protein A2144_11145 [Chloroflexi bacterium RBG_16_50_9]|nr:MAG: hypothetical protein A2144_11145 [Chloroflexi bacterium RBG_16_50_9]